MAFSFTTFKNIPYQKNPTNKIIPKHIKKIFYVDDILACSLGIKRQLDTFATFPGRLRPKQFILCSG